MHDLIYEKDLSYKDTFNGAFAVYAANIKPVLVMILLMSALVTLLQYMTGYNNIAGDIMFSERFPARDEWFRLAVFAAVLYALVYPAINGGLAYITLKTAQNNTPGIKDIFVGMFTKLHKIIPTMLLFYAFVAAGVPLLAPGLYFIVIYNFSACAVIVTNRWGLGALSESAAIVRGRFLKTTGFLILSVMFFFASSLMFNYALSFLISFIPYSAVADFVSLFILFLCECYFTTVTCYWFINKHNILKKAANRDMRIN
jgi:hypothetical protein